MNDAAMNRRRFLKGLAIGTGALVGSCTVGLGGLLTAIQPRRTLVNRGAAGDVSKPLPVHGKPRVVVIGGGIAGLSAAIELAERNCDVTLLEQGPHLGGRMAAWTERALGEEFPVEHGFHGFFAQYYNLDDLLRRAGAFDNILDTGGYPLAFADREEELFGRTTTIFPFNLLSVVRHSKTLELKGFTNDGDRSDDLMRFDGEKTFAELDNLDLDTFFVQRKINRPFIETMLEPFARTTFNRPARLSAAEALRFFHFYFTGNPDGMSFRYAKQDLGAAVLRPLGKHLERARGTVRLATAARKLVIKDGRVAQVIVDGGAGEVTATRVPVAQVPERGFVAWTAPSGVPMLLGRRADEIVAFDARCTHLGCPVGYDAVADGFLCPCHGGKFDREGRVLAGPPPRPLVQLRARRDGADVVLESAGAPRHEAIDCDYVVSACEVRGLRRLMQQSDDYLGDATLRRQIGGLGESDPYVVYRLWLDKPVRPDRYPFYSSARFRYLDAAALYSVCQEPYVSWAKRTGGSVVELHNYGLAPELVVAPAIIAAVMRQEMVKVLPELAGAKVLHEIYQQQSNFSRFAPGDYAERPSTTTAIPNLFLAGDHIKLGLPAALMEAATISGRLAANAILEREGARAVPITTVALRGPLVGIGD